MDPKNEQAQRTAPAAVHMLDCPGGPWCYCGVSGVPRATLRTVLPRARVVQAPAVPKAGLVRLPRAKVGA